MPDHKAPAMLFSTSRALTATRSLHAVAVAAGLAGCTEAPELSSTAQLATVASFGSSGCSTAVVIGLSKQISDEVGCLNPEALVPFEASSKITLSSSAVLPYLAKRAATDLVAASQVGSLQINSAFRSIAQQYLLYRWYQNGRCGITAAAPVGRSNHESGRAIDLANYSSRISTMGNRGWAHSVPGDPVHFDHRASPDNRGLDTKAFQRLWNRNNPNDTIAEDGSYGPQTEARLQRSPATGFALGPSCGNRAALVDLVAVDGPDRVAPGDKVHYSVTIKNLGQTDWPATTQILVAHDSASELYDADSWTSPTMVGTLGEVVLAGGQLVVPIEVVTPQVLEPTPVMQELALSDEGHTIGMIQIAFTVTPTGDAETSTDDGDRNDTADEITGGCSTGGGAGWLGLAIPALAMLRRRRR